MTSNSNSFDTEHLTPSQSKACQMVDRMGNQRSQKLLATISERASKRKFYTSREEKIVPMLKMGLMILAPSILAESLKAPLASYLQSRNAPILVPRQLKANFKHLMTNSNIH
jgi:hypothetical protein